VGGYVGNLAGTYFYGENAGRYWGLAGGIIGGAIGYQTAPRVFNALDNITVSTKIAGASVEGTGSNLPNVDKVTIDSRKVTDYALNPKNLSGGADKAKVFDSALGYNQSNAGQLMEQIKTKLPSSEAVLGKLDQYGQRFTVDIPITGPNGNTAIVRTGWILELGADVPRMTTLFVK